MDINLTALENFLHNQSIWSQLLRLACILVSAWLTRHLILFLLRRVLIPVIRSTKFQLDDQLQKHHFFQRLADLSIPVFLFMALPLIGPQGTYLYGAMERISQVYLLFVCLLIGYSLLSTLGEVANHTETFANKPVRSFMQAIKVLLSITFLFLGLAVILGRSPLFFLSGLGAMTAVILLIFKDSILGLVASIQMSALDMVRVGDWIEMPDFGADGDVIEVALTTIKVRNWDMTVTTIPSYALISDSFINWRGMSESGGRRIKRSVHIDVRTIDFVRPEQMKRLEKIQNLSEFLKRRKQEIEVYNQKHDVDESVDINGRKLTNIGCFRAYLIEYLRRHPKIHQDMILLVRQLQSGAKGLPIEIYVFSKKQAWVEYETIQADIFDHVFASLKTFGLRPYQFPTQNGMAEPDQD